MTRQLKYIIAFISVLLIRLLPFRAPNVEPVMSFLLPMSRKFNFVFMFLFGFLSIFIYDVLTFKVGIWTIITGFVYGLVGLFSYFYLKNRNTNWKVYGGLAFFMTIFYDLVTGLTIGPLFFGQSFTASVVGQIPFTILHLISNVSFAIIISPVIERWMSKESKSVSVLVLGKKLV